VLLEELFVWARRDLTQRKKDGEGTIIATRLRELAASEDAEQTKPIAAEFPSQSIRRNH
jgi:hypothetical protein